MYDEDVLQRYNSPHTVYHFDRLCNWRGNSCLVRYPRKSIPYGLARGHGRYVDGVHVRRETLLVDRCRHDSMSLNVAVFERMLSEWRPLLSLSHQQKRCGPSCAYLVVRIGC